MGHKCLRAGERAVKTASFSVDCMHNRINLLISGSNTEYVLHYGTKTELTPGWVILIYFFHMVLLVFKYFILKEAVW